ncbi:MAG: hypothetical protein V7603_1590 [Micromonosporaceae bacterium]
MTDEQWRRPTRLGGWDVRSLYAHAAMWPATLAALVERVRDAEPAVPTAAALLRYVNAPDGIAHSMREQTATNASEDAARLSTAQMVNQFAATGPQAIAGARRLGSVVVDYFRALMPLEEAVSIGILEATVHLLDLLDALGRPAAEVPAEGLAHTVAVLVQMAPPVDLIEAATGRGRVGLFPLLS